MGVEFEIKYRATDAVLEKIAQDFSEQSRTFCMETTYYDTPSGALSARYFTLRKRMENDISVCTLKTPLPGQGRGEWEVVCNDITDAIDALCNAGAPKVLPVLTAEGLIAVCGAKFERIAKTLTLENCIVELALDCGVLHGAGQELPFCEVEIELKEGSQEACIAFANALAQKYALTREKTSKFRRALALYQGGKPC